MEWLQTTWDWVKERETLLTWVGVLSALTLVVSVVAVPIVVRRMPSDYFLENSVKADLIREQHPLLRVFFHLLKNLVGGILVIGGILLLLTPGQGILTIMIGLMLMDFPGKRALEIRLVSMRPLNRAINWMRRRGGKPPLELPESPEREAT